MSARPGIEEIFDAVSADLLGALGSDEALALRFEGEASDFMRFNEGRVRQIGRVERYNLGFTYFRRGKTVASAFDLSGDRGPDAERAAAALCRARKTADLLPEDPWQCLPSSSSSSREERPGRLPDPSRIPDTVLGPGSGLAAAGAAFVGLHSQGWVCRGAANSSGSRHWFAAETFCTDYSAYLPTGKAVKSSYAGSEWDDAEYSRRLSSAAVLLEPLARQASTLDPGGYRAWISPDALSAIIPFFSEGGLGERCLREGESAFTALRGRRRALSPRFSLRQDFGLGIEPRFNELGELAPASLALIDRGELVNTLVSARSAKKYGVISNAAPEEETLRSAAIDAGELDEDDALAMVGTGLYLSNLHYLSWSDNDSARLTGMTRFVCFWVEKGRIVAPIEDMSFDESLYRLLGDKLLGLGRQRSLVPETETYFGRSLGGALVPGILVEDLSFTL